MVQVGGTLVALEEHVAAAKAHEWLGEAVDYKLAPSSGPRSDQASTESGFTTLSVALCKVPTVLTFDHGNLQSS